MLYSLLLSTFIIVFLSAISYVFILSLIQRDIVDTNVYEVLKSAAALGRAFLFIGVGFLALATVLSFSFARSLTQPFLEIRRKVELLGPKHWKYRQTVHTGDEVEKLDSVVADLTKRLQRLYTNLEGEVRSRTRQLEHEFAKDRAILHSLVLGLLVVDQKGVIVESNPAAGELLRRKYETLIGQKISDVMQLKQHRKRVPANKHPVYNCLRRHGAVHVDPGAHLTVVREDGSMVPIKLSVVPFRRKGRMLGAIVLAQDVTTERQIDYMKTDFLHLASHHLRTPLSTLQWYLELLRDTNGKQKGENGKMFIVEMQLAAKKMAAVVDNLMDASRLGEGGIEPVLSDVDLVGLVGDVVKSSAASMAERKVSCTVQHPKHPTVVHSDPLLLGIVVQNVLNNAVRYSKEDSGSISVQFEQTASNVNIHVRDNGIGIPLSEQEYIFDKLYRASNAKQHEVDGMGLGLYSSRMIARKLGTEIRFKSREGKGSVFTVSVPLKRTTKRTTKKQP